MSVVVRIQLDNRGRFHARTGAGWCGHRHQSADTAFRCRQAAEELPAVHWAHAAPRRPLIAPPRIRP